ncbi:MAG: tetratricopeptide repeat protein [Candidatus Electrothrix sp. AUS1_2]|nr:tetratricopeptide repeat protein [Candidatus Electrothrix sp. AUS1_2]
MTPVLASLSMKNLSLLRQPTFGLVIITLITILIYQNNLAGDFLIDDSFFVYNNPSIRSLANTPSFFFSSESMSHDDSDWGTKIYRPIRTLTYALDYHIYGLNSVGYRFSNLLLHITVCITLFYLAKGLAFPSLAAFFGTLLFAIHPVHVEAVSWISSRADLLGLLFLNLSLIFYIKYRNCANHPFFLLIVAIGMSLLAYFSKEATVPLPGLIIAFDFAVTRSTDIRRFFRSRFPAWLLFSLALFVYLVIRYRITGKFSQDQDWWGGTIYSNFLMMAKATAIYIRLLVFPVQLKLHYIITPVYSLLDSKVIFSLLLILCTFIIIFFMSRQNRIISFLLVWFYITLIPIANIIPISLSMMAERFMYLPSAGPILVFGYGAWIIYEKIHYKKKFFLRVVIAVYLFILIICSYRVITRNRVFINNLYLSASAVATSPKSAFAHYGYAEALYLIKEDYDAALAEFDKAIQLCPDLVGAFTGQAKIYIRMGDFQSAKIKAKRAIELDGTNAKNWVIFGDISTALKNFTSAELHYKRATELSENYFDAYFKLGKLFQDTERYREALLYYKKCLHLNRFHVKTNYNIATCYYAIGMYSQAKYYYSIYNALLSIKK